MALTELASMALMVAIVRNRRRTRSAYGLQRMTTQSAEIPVVIPEQDYSVE